MKISFTKKPMNPMIEKPTMVWKQIFLYSVSRKEEEKGSHRVSTLFVPLKPPNAITNALVNSAWQRIP